MTNGYALPSQEGIEEISKRLLASGEHELDELRGLLQIGVQWNTQVTQPNCQHLVTQAYCSALPVSYTTLSTTLWAPFAKLVLEASYEATLCAAVLNANATSNRMVYLTMIGSGAFGNEPKWIMAAMKRALDLHQTENLDVVIVSRGGFNGYVRKLAEAYSV